MDDQRLRELLYEGAIPENTAEELCVYAYQMALEGKLLKDVIFSITEEFDSADTNELRHLICGYVVGQSQINSIEELIKETIH